MIKEILLTAVILAVAFIALAIRVIFHKSHSFPETSAGHNLEMRKRGITCPKKEEPFCNGTSQNDSCSNCSGINE